MLLICPSQLVTGDQLARLTVLAGLGQIRLELAAGRKAVPELSFSQPRHKAPVPIHHVCVMQTQILHLHSH